MNDDLRRGTLTRPSRGPSETEAVTKKLIMYLFEVLLLAIMIAVLLLAARIPAKFFTFVANTSPWISGILSQYLQPAAFWIAAFSTLMATVMAYRFLCFHWIKTSIATAGKTEEDHSPPPD